MHILGISQNSGLLIVQNSIRTVGALYVLCTTSYKILLQWLNIVEDEGEHLGNIWVSREKKG